MKNFFKDWNFKKHAKLVTGVYLVCYAIDMTLGYAVSKKCLGTSQKADEEEYCDTDSVPAAPKRWIDSSVRMSLHPRKCRDTTAS